MRYRPTAQLWFYLLVLCCIGLGYLGAQPPEGWYLIFGRIFTAYYFAFFLVIMPLVGMVERPRALPGSITEAVLGPKDRRAAAGKLRPEAVG